MKFMKSTIIIGTGDYAEVAYQYLKRDNIVTKAFCVEKKFKKLNEFCGLPVLDFESIVDTHPKEKFQLLVAIGPNQVNTVRERIFKESKAMGYSFLTYISPMAFVWDKSKVGENSFIFDNCVVEYGVEIGYNTVMWSGSSVAHHSKVGNHCFLAPSSSISGRVIIEDNCFIGINSTIRDNIKVSKKTIVGCGSVIKKNTESNGVYSRKKTELRNLNSLETNV